MSGGQKISDKSFWAGRGSNGSVFPMGAKVKGESSAEGVGNVSKYEDTTAAIKEQQMMGERKAKGHPLKTTFRN